MTQSDLRPGDLVTLVTPGNPRLHGKTAHVEAVTLFGALLRTPAAGSGHYRALFSEMISMDTAAMLASASRQEGYTGDSCDQCGQFKLRRNGACLQCDACGMTSGCS